MPKFQKVTDIDSARLAALALPADTDNARGVLANLMDYLARNTHAELTRHSATDTIPVEQALPGLARHVAWHVHPSTGANEVLAPDLFDDGSTHAEWFVVVNGEATQFFTGREAAKTYLFSDATGKATRMYRWATPEPWGLDSARQQWTNVAPADLDVLYDDTLAPRALNRAPQYRTLIGLKPPQRGLDIDVAGVLVAADALAAFATTNLTEAFDEVSAMIAEGSSDEDYISVGGVLLRLIGRFEEYLTGQREAEERDFMLAPREGNTCYLIVTRDAHVRVVSTKQEAAAVLRTRERASITAVLPGRVTVAAASWQDVTAEATGEKPLYLNPLDD